MTSYEDCRARLIEDGVRPECIRDGFGTAWTAFVGTDRHSGFGVAWVDGYVTRNPHHGEGRSDVNWGRNVRKMLREMMSGDNPAELLRKSDNEKG